VHFVGQLDDDELSRSYHSADALVMPSLHEGFCVPVLEAMACGLPVIASRSAALPETVGDAGLTFVPGNVDDLVSQIRRVIPGGRGSCRAESVAEPVVSLEFRLGRSLALPISTGTASKNACPTIAVVSFRFGPEIVGGAETSLRTMARALQEAGHRVEVF